MSIKPLESKTGSLFQTLEREDTSSRSACEGSALDLTALAQKPLKSVKYGSSGDHI
jgi:hypothetical protein